MGERRERTYYLDTYALIEILEGNPNYSKYLDSQGTTCIMNLYELYYQLLRSAGKEIAEIQFKRFKSILTNIKDEHVKEASKIKIEHQISYADALGYAISRIEKIKFLTGDEDFRNMDNVEFVK